MADIKIREMKKGTIKTLDKAAVALDKIKNISAKTKDMTQINDSPENSSPTSYASDNISRGVETASGNAFNKAEIVGKRSMADTRKNLIKARSRVKELRRAGKGVDELSKKTIKTGGKSLITSRQSKLAAERGRKTAAQSARATKKASKVALNNAKRVGQATIKAVKLAVAGVKALVSALIAMGWVAVIVIIICCLFGAAFYFFGDSSSSNYTPVSKEVEAYDPIIREYANKYGIGEYVDLIKAVMMQESGGKGKDPMQASEGQFNKKYSKSPNGITDPKYSVECGVQELKSVLTQAKVKNPVDMARIRLALQGYNYGNGYISWAIKKDGGYTVANAAEFSDTMAKKKGWSSYGDKQYVAHVLRYYPYGNYNYGIGNGVITKVALEQVGNKGGKPYWSWYGFSGRVEWCACFVSWCADQCGYIKSGVIPKFSIVNEGVNWFKKKGQFQNRDYKPSAGDIIFFDWGGDGKPDHVGIVEKCDGKTVYTIEGNSGDACKKQKYSVGGRVVYGYGVPKY